MQPQSIAHAIKNFHAIIRLKKGGAHAPPLPTGLVFDLEISSRNKTRMFSAIFLPRTNNCSWFANCGQTHSTMCAYACSYYSRAATTSFTELHLHVQLPIVVKCPLFSNPVTYHICSIRRRSRIVAAPPEVLNEIVATLE